MHLLLDVTVANKNDFWIDEKYSVGQDRASGIDLTEYFEHLKRDSKELLEKEPQNAEYHREDLSMGGES